MEKTMLQCGRLCFLFHERLGELDVELKAWARQEHS